MHACDRSKDISPLHGETFGDLNAGRGMTNDKRIAPGM